MHSPQHPSHRDSPGDVTLEFPDLLPKDQLSQVDHISNRCINLRFDLLVLTLNIHHMEFISIRKRISDVQTTSVIVALGTQEHSASSPQQHVIEGAEDNLEIHS